MMGKLFLLSLLLAQCSHHTLLKCIYGDIWCGICDMTLAIYVCSYMKGTRNFKHFKTSNMVSNMVSSL